MRPARLLCAAAAALLAAGCAVHSNPGKPLQLRLDQAEVFGQDLAELRLPDGGTAKLRQLQGRFSVKLPQFQRVVEIDKATSVRFVGAHQVADRTLVVLEKSQRNCALMTQLLSFKGPEVRAWDFGCDERPRIEVGADEAVFDLPHRRGTTRYIYGEGGLVYGELRGAAAARSSSMPAGNPAGSGAGRPIAFPLPPAAAPPAAAPQAGAPQAAAPARPTTATRPATKDAPVVLPKPALDFPRQQAPRTIYMDR